MNAQQLAMMKAASAQKISAEVLTYLTANQHQIPQITVERIQEQERQQGVANANPMGN